MDWRGELLSRRPRSRDDGEDEEVVRAESGNAEENEETEEEEVDLRIELLSAGDGGQESREMLRPSIFDVLASTGARNRERSTRDDERLRAASNEGLDVSSSCHSGVLGTMTSTDCEQDAEDCVGDFFRSVSRSSSVMGGTSPSSPHPTPHATSSTIAIVQRVETERSRQPLRIRSALRPMSEGTS